MKVKIVHNAKDATGIAVVIDVFRAFTVEPYLMNNGARTIIPVGEKEFAYELKQENNDYILIGERNGIKLPDFDYGNSPSQIENIDFLEKTIVHTTSCGTQGIVNAKNATEIITGSLVNAKAIAKYILKNNFSNVSLLSLARENENPSPEDELCAYYIKSLLEGKTLHNFEKKVKELKYTSGAKFFDKTKQEVFPEKDFYLCTEVNKFNFILKVNKETDGNLFIEKIEV